jgi:type I site-specific restriction endonuclease
MSSSTYDESEWQTRRKRIDTRLEALGWALVPFDAAQPLDALPQHTITDFETANGPADYALSVDGRILGIVEAKRLSLGPQNALVQAERYARGVTGNPFNFRGLHVPFLYSTNGEVLWFHDVRHPLNRSRRVANFHTPNALKELLAEPLAFKRSLSSRTLKPSEKPWHKVRPSTVASCFHAARICGLANETIGICNLPSIYATWPAWRR